MNKREQKTKESKLKGMTIAEASYFIDEHDIFEFEGVKEVTDTKGGLILLFFHC